MKRVLGWNSNVKPEEKKIKLKIDRFRF